MCVNFISRIIPSELSEGSRKIPPVSQGFAAKMKKPRKTTKKHREDLDKDSAKSAVGRPRKVNPRWIRGRADNYREIFGEVWARLWSTLRLAESADDVTKEFQRVTPKYADQFVPALSEIILGTLRDPDFPKTRKAQVNFLADSIAGTGLVTPRRSRDICEEERGIDKNSTRIMRYEFYVECSCGYKGRSLDHACKRCGARLQDTLTPTLGNTAFPPIKHRKEKEQ